MESRLTLSECRSIAAVIPAYQPAANLIGLVKTLYGAGYPVVVVDDGSGEDCLGIWNEIISFASVIHHPKNMGKGAALKTAFEHIRENMSEISYIITLDADGQHLFDDAERVAACSIANPGTLVLGSRTFGKNVPLRSKFGNTVTRFVFSCVAGYSVGDTQTGLRAFDRSLLGYMLGVDGERYEYEMNVLLRCRENGIPVAEVPIRTVYLDAENSSSHFDAIRDSAKIYGNIFRFASPSIISSLADYAAFLLLKRRLSRKAGSLAASNLIARAISAPIGCFLRSKRGAPAEPKKYAARALLEASIGSAVIAALAESGKIPAWASKLITEAALFVLKRAVQPDSCPKAAAGAKQNETGD